MRVTHVGCGEELCPALSPLSPVQTLSAAMAFHVSAILWRSEEKTGHCAGPHSVGQSFLPGHLWKMNSVCAFVCVHWGELCSGHSEETYKSPPEFMGGAFGLSERRNW